MAYRYLVEIRHMLLKILQVVEVEVMPGIHSQPHLVGCTRSLDIRGYGLFGILPYLSA